MIVVTIAITVIVTEVMTAQRAETVLHCEDDVTDTGSRSSSLRQFCFDLCLPAGWRAGLHTRAGNEPSRSLKYQNHGEDPY